MDGVEGTITTAPPRVLRQQEMTNTEDVQHRTYHQPEPGRVTLRESSEDEGVFRVRMPIATTGEVRNQGDDPLTRDELTGMAEQVEAGAVGVFIDHGSNFDVADARYSATEKVGEWEDAATQEREQDDETELVATARLMDPETLPDTAGSIREALSSLKEQVKREMSLSASIGWREDDSYPGGVDLMESSIVGIPADPRTTSHDATVAHAREILDDAGLSAAEREDIVSEFRAAVMGPTPDTDHDMTTDDSESESDDPSAGPDDSQNEGMDEAEYRESMLEMQRQQTETLQTLTEALRADDDEAEDDEDEEEEQDNDDEEDDEEEEQSTEPETEQDADPEGARTVEVDGEEVDAHKEIRRLRDALDEADVEVPDPDTEHDEEEPETTRSSDGSDGPNWRA